MLVSMAIDGTKRDVRTSKRPEYARILERRRKDLGKTKEQLIDETGGVLYRQFLHRVLTGEKDPHTLTYEQVDMLAAYYEWSPTRLSEVLGIKPSRVESVNQSDTDLVVLNVLYPVDMGRPEKTPTGDNIALSTKTLRRLSVKGNDLEPYIVDENVWVSFRVADEASIIADDVFCVEIGARPLEPGDVVALKNHKDNIAILCRKDEIEGKLPYYVGGNIERPETLHVTLADRNLDVIGVVRYKAGMV